MRFLDRDAATRLGAGASGSADVCAHAFWGLEWEKVRGRKYPTGWTPPSSAEQAKAAEEAAAKKKEAKAAKEAAKAAAMAAYEAGEGEYPDSDEDDDDEEEEDDDEWHLHVPGGGGGGGDDLFRGFTFRREPSLPSISSPITRAATLKRSRSKLPPSEARAAESRVSSIGE